MSEIKNGSIVALEFAPTVSGRIVKTHLAEHGSITYDVQINYSFNPGAELERLRIRDVPGRCLIWQSDESLTESNADDRLGDQPAEKGEATKVDNRHSIIELINQLDIYCVNELDPDDYKDHWIKVYVALKYAGKK